MTMHIKLPDHITESNIEKLISSIAASLFYGNTEEPVGWALDACDLQPTTRAAHLAAEAAVCVLLAHEIGQEVGK